MRKTPTEEQAIMGAIAARHEVELADVLGRARAPVLTIVRRAIALELQSRHYYTEAEIGAALCRGRGGARYLLEIVR
jgi:hypothetical protein